MSREHIDLGSVYEYYFENSTKKREREREKKIYTAVTCTIGKRQKTLPTFFSYEWQIALQ